MITGVQDANKIGVAKKCCWLCQQLSEVMRKNGQAFHLPGTSGLIFSWAPPTGLDITILQQVEDRLKERLFKFLEKYVKDALKKEGQSHQSSPTTSLTDIRSPLPIADDKALELLSKIKKVIGVKNVT